MGYCSDYSLETNPELHYDNELTAKVAEAFMNAQPEYFRSWQEERDFAIRFVAGFAVLADVKWYECKDDIEKISKQFPDVAFAINRVGEDNDVEAYYVKNGDTEVQYRDVDTSRPSPQSEKFKELFK